MNLREYQNWTAKTAIYRKTCPEWADKIAYVSLGLAGEAGEIANKVKKVMRDGTYDKKDVMNELGDVLWYLARCCAENDTSLEEVANLNIKKLEGRLTRNTIKGSGDNR
jgi:NTP pyrophosphatase (non-canonical NTP hydrolase)